jgi:hypothetical protein
MRRQEAVGMKDSMFPEEFGLFSQILSREYDTVILGMQP